jgi:murein peptide amidase A
VPTTRLNLASVLAALVAGLAQAPHVQASPRASTEYLGHSLRGRPIVAYHSGDETGPRVLVFGSIHGDETAGIPIARKLIDEPALAGSDIWVVPDLNPDGTALHRRQNGDGIDLNRNFPYRWQPIGDGGSFDYPGPRPLSEPESQFAVRLIITLHPAVTIWFHQALRVVDQSGGSVAIERQFSQLAGLPLRRLERYPGSGPTWQNHRFPGTTSFVVELPAGRLSQRAVDRYARAVVTLARRRS